MERNYFSRCKWKCRRNHIRENVFFKNESKRQEIQFRLEFKKIEATENKEVYFICQFQDVSEIVMERNQMISDQEQNLQSTLDNMLEGIQIIDENWKYIYVNKAVADQGKKLKSELIGNTMLEVYPGIDTTEMFTLLKAVMQKREPREMINEFSYPDGTKGWFQLYFHPVPEGVCILSIDVSEVIAAQNMLEEKVAERTAQYLNVNTELEAFSYSVSHDLRAPLRAINGFANILKEEYAEVLDQEGKRLVSIIAKNAMKMGELIDDLLTFSRLGNSELNMKELDMNLMIKNIIKDLEFNYLGKLQITNEVTHRIFGDETSIRQVWINLISNAFKYSSTREIQKIHISSKEIDNEIVFAVSDNGVGYDDNFSDKLFVVFQRLHTSSEFEGNGVGLATVKRVVQKHGGRVWSTAELDKGATFYFSIPKSRAI